MTRLQGHRDVALQQLEETGGRQALESHLKAQKANWKFLGQKEAFLQRESPLPVGRGSWRRVKSNAT